MRQRLRTWFARISPALRRSGPLLLVAILIAGFAFTLLRAGTGSPPPVDHAQGLNNTATSSQTTSATTTPPYAFTATPHPPGGGGPVHTPDGSDPFKVTSLFYWTTGSPSNNTPDVVYDDRCFQSPVPFVVQAAPGVPRESISGDIIYRWHVNGSVTAPSTLHYRWDEDPTLRYTLNVDAAVADGSMNTVQLEIMSPNPLLSPVAHISVRCQMYVNGGYGIGQYSFICPGNTSALSQSMHIETHIPVMPSPGGQVTYHWELPDGSNSPGQTVTIAPGARESSALVSWTITLTPDSPDGVYRLSLITTAPNSDRLTLSYFTKTCAGYVTPTLTLG